MDERMMRQQERSRQALTCCSVSNSFVALAWPDRFTCCIVGKQIVVLRLGNFLGQNVTSKCRKTWPVCVCRWWKCLARWSTENDWLDCVIKRHCHINAGERTIISLVRHSGHRIARNGDNYGEGECVPTRNNGTGGTENDWSLLAVLSQVFVLVFFLFDIPSAANQPHRTTSFS